MALLQAWWRRTFPAEGHLSVDELARGRLEREAPSDVDAETFLEELGRPAFEGHAMEEGRGEAEGMAPPTMGRGEAEGSVAAALLRTWWRGRVPDPDGWWIQSVLEPYPSP